MEQLLFFVVILACPLLMMFMMRGSQGGHGGHGGHMPSGNEDHFRAMDDSDARIAELERQVASLEDRLRAYDSSAPPTERG